MVSDNSPLFSLAFLRAKDIISEKGSILCHLSILAREMEVPCVVGLENATKLIKENQIIEIDSDKREIRLFKDEQENK